RLAGAEKEAVTVLHGAERVSQPKADAGARDGNGARRGAAEVHFEISGELLEARPAACRRLRFLGDVGVDPQRNAPLLRAGAGLRDVALEGVRIRQRFEVGAGAAAAVGRAVDAREPEIAADAQLGRPDLQGVAFGLLLRELLRWIERLLARSRLLRPGLWRRSGVLASAGRRSHQTHYRDGKTSSGPHAHL